MLLLAEEESMPTQIRAPWRQIARAPFVESTWRSIVAMFSNPDLIAVLLFCLIGLLIAVTLVLRFQEIGAAAFAAVNLNVN
jgi:hypothetical protein